jgi:hypothetical protein
MKKLGALLVLVILIAIIAVAVVLLTQGYLDYPAGTYNNNTNTMQDECAKMNSSERVECYKESAEKKGDPKICEKLNESSKNECYRNFVELAKKEQDSKICGNVGDGNIANDCYTQLALLQDNSTLCKMAGNLSTECLSGLAMKTTNSEFCVLIEDDIICDDCLMSIAVMNYDENTCERVSNQTKRILCLQYIKDEYVAQNITG